MTILYSWKRNGKGVQITPLYRGTKLHLWLMSNNQLQLVGILNWRSAHLLELLRSTYLNPMVAPSAIYARKNLQQKLRSKELQMLESWIINKEWGFCSICCSKQWQSVAFLTIQQHLKDCCFHFQRSSTAWCREGDAFNEMSRWRMLPFLLYQNYFFLCRSKLPGAGS